jgi:aryl-alcohol dehydrogenase-like predicted oxidoreductase
MWSVLDRSFEREIIPMAKAEGLALAPWGVVGGGKIRTDEEEQNREQSGEKGRQFFGDWKRTPKEVNISRKVGEIAKQLGVKHITAVAIAYVMHVSIFICRDVLS